MTSASLHLGTSRRALACVGTSLFLGALVARVGGIIALVAPATVGVLLLVAVVNGLIQWPDEAARRRIMWWTMVAFAAHLLFGLTATNITPRIRLYLGADSFLYHEQAKAIVSHWTSGLPLPSLTKGKEGFYYLLASLYWVFGSYTAAGLALNATLSAALVPVVSDTTNRLYGQKAAHYVAPLVLLMPGLFLWTSQLVKEAPILLMLAVALNCAVRLVERVSVTAVVVLTTTLAVAFTFRAWVALVVAAGLILGIAVGHGRLVSGVGTGLSALLVVASVMVFSGLGYSGYQTAVGTNLEQANTVRRGLARDAKTGFESEVDISSTPNAAKYLPRGVLSFLFGPFPWQISGLRQLPVVPDMLAWWLLLPSLWGGYRAGRQLVGRMQFLILLPALGTVLMMSLALGNFGTIIRERLQVVVLVVPILALGLAERAARHGLTAATVDERPELLPEGLATRT